MQLLTRYCQSAVHRPGVSATRIEASERTADTQYLFYHDIDIALDGAPSNGGVTSLDTFMDGVPWSHCAETPWRPDWAPRF